jgi:PAS domain S-box-containing protein
MDAAAIDRISQWTVKYGLKPFGVAGFFVLVAFLWTLLLQHVIAYPFLFLFFGAVMGSAWFGGIVAGFMAVVLSSLFVTYFFVPPLFSMSVAQPSQTYLAAFIICSFAVSLVTSSRRRSENVIRDARDQLEARVLERTADLRQANFELKESGRRLHALTEAIPQQMWSADAEGRIEYCNQDLIRYIGRPASGPLAEAFAGILHSVDERIFRQICRSALAEGRAFEVDARIQGADDVYRWFLIRSIPQHSTDGKVTHWHGIHIDIEQKYQVQQGLTIERGELSRLSRTLSLGELAVSIAHELNQPLTAVVTHAYACREWLRADPPNFDKATYTADRIVQESTRASAVVARVRALFRKEPLIREATDLNHLVVALARLLRDETIRRNATIKLLLADDLPRVNLDPVQIQQVLFNLTVNAMDAMSVRNEPRELTIRSELHGANEVEINVEDRGVGLAPEVATRMFEPFFTTKPEGTGMGLAICRSIIEAHDGRIWATQSPFGGAIVHFTLRIPS